MAQEGKNTEWNIRKLDHIMYNFTSYAQVYKFLHSKSGNKREGTLGFLITYLYSNIGILGPLTPRPLTQIILMLLMKVLEWEHTAELARVRTLYDHGVFWGFANSSFL